MNIGDGRSLPEPLQPGDMVVIFNAPVNQIGWTSCDNGKAYYRIVQGDELNLPPSHLPYVVVRPISTEDS